MIAPARPNVPMKAQRDAALLQLGLNPATADLDHDPALGLRYRDEKTGKYEPDANDPRFLKWKAGVDHDHKTFKDNGTGRGDLTAIAHVKRVRRREAHHLATLTAKLIGDDPPAPVRRKRKIASRPFGKQHRPLRSRNDLRKKDRGLR